MLSPLLIARKENAGILKSIGKELEFFTPREQIGSDWSLKLFLQSDVKNYSLQTHFILDASAFQEKNDEFIGLLEGISLQNEKASIIIYAGDFFAGDDFLNKLIQKGYTNIVASFDTNDERKNIELMTEDLKECFSPDGLSQRKYRRYDKCFSERPVFAIKEAEAILPRYENASFTVSVFGAMDRIGTTSYAVHLCDYITRRGGTAALVILNNGGDRQRIKDLYQATENGGYITVNAIDIYDKSNLPAPERYNVIVFDVGVISKGKEYLGNTDITVLCAGTGWNELAYTKNAHKYLNGINYMIAVNFSSENECKKHEDALNMNFSDYVIMPFSPEPFNAKENDALFDKLYADWQIAAEEEELEIG
jgi:hypothetical protein